VSHAIFQYTFSFIFEASLTSSKEIAERSHIPLKIESVRMNKFSGVSNSWAKKTWANRLWLGSKAVQLFGQRQERKFCRTRGWCEVDLFPATTGRYNVTEPNESTDELCIISCGLEIRVQSCLEYFCRRSGKPLDEDAWPNTYQFQSRLKLIQQVRTSSMDDIGL
jgi:hypothetical protein